MPSLPLPARTPVAVSSALSFKEISLKNDYHCGGKDQYINTDILYNLFERSLFCSSLFESPFPHEEGHMQISSESTGCIPTVAHG